MSNCCHSSHLPRGVSRRDLVRMGAVGAGILALGPIGKLATSRVGAAPQIRKRTIVMNLFGGNDSVNMFIPQNITPYYEQRTNDDTGFTLWIPQSDSIALNGEGDYALHPALPNIAQLWNDGDVAAVTKVGYPQQNLSHFSSMDIYSRGIRDPLAGGFDQSGWIARYADRYAPTPMGAVSVGVGRPGDFVGGSTNPFLVQNLAGFRIHGGGTNGNPDPADHAHRIEAVKNNLARWSNSTGNTYEAQAALGQAHDLASQIQDSVTSFSDTIPYDTGQRASRQMRDIATLIEGGFESQIFFTGFGGFDTHGGQGTSLGRQADLFSYLDNAIGSFAADMKRMNLWDDTVIIVMTEFGRRNFVNGSDGTDHGHGYTELVIGGPVNGGHYGPDLTEEDLNQNWLGYSVDFRSVYKEVLANHMGTDPAPVFPEPLEIENTLGIV